MQVIEPAEAKFEARLVLRASQTRLGAFEPIAPAVRASSGQIQAPTV